MSKEGGKITDRQIDEIRVISEQYDIGTCLQCAAAIKSYLKFQQMLSYTSLMLIQNINQCSKTKEALLQKGKK